MIVLAGAALGVGVYFFDFHIGQVIQMRTQSRRCFASRPEYMLPQVVQQFVDMDQVATALALSPSGYLITIGTDDRLVKVVDYDEV